MEYENNENKSDEHKQEIIYDMGDSMISIINFSMSQKFFCFCFCILFHFRSYIHISRNDIHFLFKKFLSYKNKIKLINIYYLLLIIIKY